MYETVPSYVKPSGGLVLPSASMLPAIPKQPTAKTAADSIEQPRTWSFVARPSGDLLSVTCMPGCETDHSGDMETPTHPDDIWCQSHSKTVTLPVNDTGTPEEVPVLSWTLNVRPFDRNLNARMPHACVEVMQDAWIEDLDPDAFETVIGTLEERVKAMRAAHAELVRARAEYKAGR